MTAITKREMAELAARHDCGAPETVMRARRSGSLVTLALRVGKVSDAYKAKDVTAARYELQALADEASMMAKQDRLWP